MKKVFTLLGIVAVGSAVFAQQLLVNPGFEAGLAPWAAGTGSGYTAPVISSVAPNTGSGYAEYINPSATTGFYQNVPVTAGKTYTISFWYKSAGDDSDTRLWSVYKNATGGAVYSTANADTDEFRTNNQYLANAASWIQFTATMPAPTGATSLDVAVRVYGGASIAQFDDFAAYEQGTLSVTDLSAFDKQVKMNTVVGNELKVILPGKATVNIYAVDGRLVSSNRVDNGQAINTSSMAKGNYVVTVDNGSAKVSRKVIKN